MFINFLGYDIYASGSKSLKHEIQLRIKEKKRTLISTINPHSYVKSRNDLLFRKSLKSSTYIIPDGVGIVIAIFLILKSKISRITGRDLFYELNSIEPDNGPLKIFFLGSTPSTLERISEKMDTRYASKVEVGFFSPPFKEQFDEKTTAEMVDAVNSFKPHILWVGMTAPKQEKWAFENFGHLNALVVGSVGAVFDFVAGTVEEAPKLMRDLGLEWLHRFFSEPGRLWQRVFISSPLFVLDVAYRVLRGKEAKF